MNKVWLVNFIGLLVVMAVGFALVRRANAAYLTCPGNIILCTQGCEANLDWVNLYPCCDQVPGGCCVRNCMNYHCEGVSCQWLTEGHLSQVGNVEPGNCGFNPDCYGEGP